MNRALQTKAIRASAKLVSGERLNALYCLCESQKTVSTRKLEWMLDAVWESNKSDGMLISELCKALPEEAQNSG